MQGETDDEYLDRMAVAGVRAQIEYEKTVAATRLTPLRAWAVELLKTCGQKAALRDGGGLATPMTLAALRHVAARLAELAKTCADPEQAEKFRNDARKTISYVRKLEREF